MTIRKGTIVSFEGSPGSGTAIINIGGTLVPCDAAPTLRALRAAFGWNIIGQPIYYSCDELGVLSGFTPTGDAPEELVQEYERQEKPPRRGKAKEVAT